MGNHFKNVPDSNNSQGLLSRLPVGLKQIMMSAGLMSIVGNDMQAQTPKFTDEPAESPKISSVVADQKAILDMLPVNNPSRPAVEAAIKALADGGNTEELTNLFVWASAINNSPSAPPAAKEKAKNILKTLNVNPTGVVENLKQAGAKPDERPPVGGWSPEQKARIKAEAEQAKLIAETVDNLNKGFFNQSSWKVDESQNATPVLKVSKNEGIVSSFGKVKANVDAATAATAISTSTFSPALSSGEFEVNISMEGKGKLAAWFYSSTGDKMGPRIFISNGKSIITAPPGTTLVRFGLINSKSEPELKIKSFVLSKNDGSDKIAIGNPK